MRDFVQNSSLRAIVNYGMIKMIISLKNLFNIIFQDN